MEYVHGTNPGQDYEKLDLAEKREHADLETRERLLMRNFASYNERLNLLEDRSKAHTLNVEKMIEDLRMAMGVASSNMQGLEKGLQGLSSKLLMQEGTMNEERRVTQQKLIKLEANACVGGSQQPGTDGDMEGLRHDLEALRLTVTRNYEELRSQRRADSQRQIEHDQ